MHFITFILGALTAPQLTSARPPMLPQYSAFHHPQPQGTSKAASHHTPAHTSHVPNSLHKSEKRDVKAAMAPYKCPGHGAQCVLFPPDAPKNETIWIRMYCHHMKQHHKHKHHHHHHHNKPEDDPKRRNGTREFPVMMYPCPQGTWCRVNKLPDGYYPPPWLDDWEPNPDPDPDSDVPKLPDGDDSRGEMSQADIEEIVRQHADDSVAVVHDEDSGEVGVQKYVQPLPWWDIVFTCVHNDDDDQYDGPE
ncbi:hypothetical protein F4680DRAFT_450779 [Xylaria scruposa]|nr:hypothetical protein F4680DRAFT_450779 [Xylaria scruposa]